MQTPPKIADSIAAQLFRKDVPWYVRQVPPLRPEMRDLLVEYAKIQPDEVDKHVAAVRDEAWNVVCTGIRFIHERERLLI